MLILRKFLQLFLLGIIFLILFPFSVYAQQVVQGGASLDNPMALNPGSYKGTVKAKTLQVFSLSAKPSQ